MPNPCSGPAVHEQPADLGAFAGAPTDRQSTVLMQGPSLAPNVSDAVEAPLQLAERENRAIASDGGGSQFDTRKS
jgi:hypothetical protein